jgi:hypothetical protein
MAMIDLSTVHGLINGNALNLRLTLAIGEVKALHYLFDI